MQAPVLLGDVTCPSGFLVIADGGYLRLWSGERSPAELDPALMGFADPVQVEDVRASADFEVAGPDAEAAAASFDRQPGRWLYDIPASGVTEFVDTFDKHCRDHGLDARLERTARIAHRERVDRCATPTGSFYVFGVPFVAVAGLPTDRPLAVEGIRDGDEWANVVVRVRDGEVARRVTIDEIAVDWARFVVGDADALSSWQHDDPIDGLADVAFWGAAQDDVAAATGAGRLDDGGYGWSDVDLGAAAERGGELQAWQQANPQRRIALDMRPHSHHWQVMRKVRASAVAAGVVEVGGAQVLFAMTGVGDGWFPVTAEYDADDELVAIRLILG